MKTNIVNNFPDIKNSKYHSGGAATILRLIDEIVDSINIRTNNLQKIVSEYDNDIVNIKEKLLAIYSKRIKESQENNKDDKKENNKDDNKENNKVQNDNIKPEQNLQRRKSITNVSTLQKRKSISNISSLQRRKSISNKL
jgi:hypothetical protein